VVHTFLLVVVVEVVMAALQVLVVEMVAEEQALSLMAPLEQQTRVAVVEAAEPLTLDLTTRELVVLVDQA
jgi:hypothetical protein